MLAEFFFRRVLIAERMEMNAFYLKCKHFVGFLFLFAGEVARIKPS